VAERGGNVEKGASIFVSERERFREGFSGERLERCSITFFSCFEQVLLFHVVLLLLAVHFHLHRFLLSLIFTFIWEPNFAAMQLQKSTECKVQILMNLGWVFFLARNLRKDHKDFHKSNQKNK